MRKRMSRLLALFLSGTMLAGETLPVFAEEPVTEAVSDEDEYTGDGDGEDFEFVPGYIDLPEDENIPVINTGMTYGEMRAELEAVGDADDFLSPDVTATESAYPTAYTGAWLDYMKDTFPATRNQNPYGTCWAHSSIFLAEANLITHGKASRDIDLSELHLVYWVYNNGTPSAAAQGSGDSVELTEKGQALSNGILDYGGNLRHSAQTLMRQRGYAAESDIPYSNANTIASGGTLSAATERQDTVYLTNAYEISLANPGLVKSAIKENGAVGVSYYATTSRSAVHYYNADTNAYWNPKYTSTNHAVALVGWDDNYPRTNFKEIDGALPEKNGAWLARNSWSTTAKASYQSYFWISYEDTSLAKKGAWVFEADTAFPYDNHYYYDSQIYGEGYYGDCEKKFANVYMVNGAAGAETETLEAVDFNVSKIGSSGSAYTVEIYKDLTGNTPDTGILASTTEGSVYFEGQYTVKLTQPVELDKGSNYAVVISFADPEASVAVTYDVSSSYYSSTSFCEGKSYILYPGYNGNKWQQCSKDCIIGALTVDGKTSGVKRVESVSLNKNTLTLEEGETEKLKATVIPDDADDKSLTWESSDATVATVSVDGEVTAVKAGTAVITVTTKDGGYTASCSITVKKAVVNVTGVSLDQTILKLTPGQTETLTATIEPENADDLSVSWKSSDTSVATVDKGGKVTAVAAGKATITVTTNDGSHKAECTVTVSDDLQIRAVMTECTISVGMTMKAEVTVIPATAETPEYVYTSSDPTVASIDENGEIKALAVGTTTITIKTADGKATTSFKLTVTAINIAVKGIEIDQVSMELTVGETKKLAAWVTPTNATNQTIKFSTDDEDVAIVDKNGIVTAIGAGTAGITATSEDGGFSKTCTVTVTPKTVKVSGVSIDQDELVLTAGKNGILTATVEPEDATNQKVSWSSDDKSVATVDANGKVTAVAAGKAKITVTTDDGGYSDECWVTIEPKSVALTGLSTDPSTLELTVGDTSVISAVLKPLDATETDLLWTSSDTDVVTIGSELDNTVEIEALSIGKAVITVSNEDQTIKATCEVMVKKAPVKVTAVSLNKEEAELTVDGALQLKATVEPEDATNQKVSWSSDDKSIATVDANGKVTAVAEGVAKITVTTEDGEFTDDCWVTVVEKEVALTGLSIDPSEPELIVGDTSVLSAVLEPADATVTDLLWTSDNTDVVAIDSDFGDGVEITAVSVGTAIVTVTNTDKTVRATCKVTVKEAPVKVIGVSLDKEEAELTVAETLQLTATVEPEDAANQKVSWSSDDETVATVDADGKVTAIAEGTATITVTTDDGGYTAECEVTVVSGQEEPTPAPTPDYGEAPRVITQEDGSTVVYVENKPVTDYTGIAIFGTEEDAPWVYLEDGKRNQEYSGFVDYDGESFYVAGGTMASKQNGVQIDPNSGDDPVFYFVAGGMVQKHHEGLAEYDGAWFYIKDGKVQLEKNAFVEYDGGLFLVAVGRIVNEYAGLCQDPQNTQTGDWYFFSNGQAQTQYTGLALYDGHWFYVEKGKFLPPYTGTVWYDGEQFEVVNGEAVL